LQAIRGSELEVVADIIVGTFSLNDVPSFKKKVLDVKDFD
jgi:hypothetical protein